MGTQTQLPIGRPRDCTWVPSYFNNLRLGEFECSSDPADHLPTGGYNCIAHAAGENDRWWWPIEITGYYWPEGLPKDQETVDNFIKAFETKRYRRCPDGKIENGFEKVAIYVDANGIPTHAARSLPNGTWTSKLGNNEDIEHQTLQSLEGSEYGTATVFLKRVVVGSPRTGLLRMILLFLKRSFDWYQE